MWNGARMLVLAFIALLLSTQVNGTPLNYLDTYLKVQPVDDFCGAQKCNISYSISLLSAVIGSVFHSEAMLLLDGQMVRGMDHNTKYYFEDNSVVPLGQELQRADKEKQVYLGIRFFDLPEDIQEYFVVDVTDVAVYSDRRVRMDLSTETVRIQVRIHKRHEEQHLDELDNRVEQEVKTVENEAEKSSHSLVSSHHSRNTHRTAVSECACEAKECGCCEHIFMKVIHLNDTACVNVTYVSEDLGLRLTLEVDTHIYYSKELSVRNPPPVCFEVPHLRDYASLCLKLYNVEVTEESIYGCTKLEAVLYHLTVASKRLGCFRIPL